jgi:putative hydrolase of the HAD superfamily
MPRSRQIFEEAGVPLDKIFLKSFLSYEMKALKPSASFYKAVIAEIGLPSEEMIFVDDSMKNVEGAVAAGLPAVFYQPGTDLSALLAEVLDDSSVKMEEGC